MSDTPTVYHLIRELDDVPGQEDDSLGNKDEQEEPLLSSVQDPSKNVEEVEQRDSPTRLSDHRQRKRTTITPDQKTILEEFFASGMTSSGMQFSALHHAAAQKTGLSVHNIQHWIRNRRRPVCKVKGAISNHKCLDNSFTTTYTISSPTANDNTTMIYLTDSGTDHVKSYSETLPTSSQLTSSQLTVTETTAAAILVKCRIANSVEEDFVEELEVESTAVAKIRKLPNTLVRKDKDVMRLNPLQELELVLHTQYHIT